MFQDVTADVYRDHLTHDSLTNGLWSSRIQDNFNLVEA